MAVISIFTATRYNPYTCRPQPPAQYQMPIKHFQLGVAISVHSLPQCRRASRPDIDLDALSRTDQYCLWGNATTSKVSPIFLQRTTEGTPEPSPEHILRLRSRTEGQLYNGHLQALWDVGRCTRYPDHSPWRHNALYEYNHTFPSRTLAAQNVLAVLPSLVDPSTLAVLKQSHYSTVQTYSIDCIRVILLQSPQPAMSYPLPTDRLVVSQTISDMIRLLQKCYVIRGVVLEMATLMLYFRCIFNRIFNVFGGPCPPWLQTSHATSIGAHQKTNSLLLNCLNEFAVMVLPSWPRCNHKGRTEHAQAGICCFKRPIKTSPAMMSFFTSYLFVKHGDKHPVTSLSRRMTDISTCCTNASVRLCGHFLRALLEDSRQSNPCLHLSPQHAPRPLNDHISSASTGKANVDSTSIPLSLGRCTLNHIGGGGKFDQCFYGITNSSASTALHLYPAIYSDESDEKGVAALARNIVRKFIVREPWRSIVDHTWNYAVPTQSEGCVLDLQDVSLHEARKVTFGDEDGFRKASLQSSAWIQHPELRKVGTGLKVGLACSTILVERTDRDFANGLTAKD
ncbi:hypothetical protein NPX13_g7495 [Xylaria arbuscula]|uniref:Uncharacterized protein n=1 Tax=Xylaria arbuscula TaxID=114810 RepID=A0A9W8NAK4_9PEZI|nr:hypothetical protein NPX13_g7495 [Xylaria arbuscula]